MFNSLSLKVLIFGFIFTFFSSFGQSFFLGIFNPSIRNELSISHGQFGTIYASATLLSGYLPSTGKNDTLYRVTMRVYDASDTSVSLFNDIYLYFIIKNDEAEDQNLTVNNQFGGTGSSGGGDATGGSVTG